MRLAGKVVVITGAGVGIAKASAEILREGARVVVAEIDEEKEPTSRLDQNMLFSFTQMSQKIVLNN